MLRQTVNFNHHQNSSASSFLPHPHFRKEAAATMGSVSSYARGGSVSSQSVSHYSSNYPSQGLSYSASHFLPPSSQHSASDSWQRQAPNHRYGSNANNGVNSVRSSIYEEISSARGNSVAMMNNNNNTNNHNNTNNSNSQDISPLYDRQKFQRLKQRFENSSR